MKTVWCREYDTRFGEVKHDSFPFAPASLRFHGLDRLTPFPLFQRELPASVISRVVQSPGVAESWEFAEPSRWVLKIECCCCFTLVSAWMPGKARRATKPLWWLSAIAGIVCAGLRYWMTWPMTPMFSGSILYPPLLAILGSWSLNGADDRAPPVRRWLITSGLVVVLVGVCFPKDFYVPIIKTTSPTRMVFWFSAR